MNLTHIMTAPKMPLRALCTVMAATQFAFVVVEALLLMPGNPKKSETPEPSYT